MYLRPASTVLGLVLVLAILLSAVLVLDRQCTRTWQVLSQVLFYVLVKYLAISQELGKNYRVSTVMFFIFTKRHDMKHEWYKKITAMKITLCLLLLCTQLHNMKHK